ncbi:hypothetical protein ACFL6Y_04055 [Elusimicrobiota bacterium]
MKSNFIVTLIVIFIASGSLLYADQSGANSIQLKIINYKLNRIFEAIGANKDYQKKADSIQLKVKAAPKNKPAPTYINYLNLSILNKYACADGYYSMNIQVSIHTNHGSYSKWFYPSCGYYFRRWFSEPNLDCSISSSMCPSGYSSSTMEVSCRSNDGSYRTAFDTFPCPKE